jgi:hypothetical protein
VNPLEPEVVGIIKDAGDIMGVFQPAPIFSNSLATLVYVHQPGLEVFLALACHIGYLKQSMKKISDQRHYLTASSAGTISSNANSFGVPADNQGSSP